LRVYTMSSFRVDDVTFPQVSNFVHEPIHPHESIVHDEELSEHYNNLLLSSELSDITLVVEGTNLPAHKIILAARSKYFRCLFFGGMREEKEDVIELKETPLEAFTDLLKYIYTGRLCLHGMKDERVLDILMLANRCDFQGLQDDIALYLRKTLNTLNVCTVLHASQLYSLPHLTEECFLFADRNASDILLSPAFLSLSASAIEELIVRDSFCAREIEIFRAICKWKEARPEEGMDVLSSLVSRIRLPLVSLHQLLNVVRPSGLIASDVILDAIKEQCETSSSNLTHRGFLTPNVNVATSRNAQVITGDSPSALFLSPESSLSVMDGDRVFTRHSIVDEENVEGIIVELFNPFIINKIVLGLWADRETRFYSYYIEVSVDRKDWARIIDHTKYLCRSRQILLFPKRAVKYIRVVGTHNSLNRYFHLVHLEALYTTETFQVDPITKLTVPTMNVASIDRNALVIEGVSRDRNALISGISHYDWDEGYTCHQLGSGSITVQLPQPYLVSSVKLLLWDCDERSYSFYIEVSANQKQWKRVVDRVSEVCRSWQYAEFPPEPVVFIRIVGTSNSANEVFHCVHLECPATPPSPQELPSL
ncbi:hypothetical protein PMAYCL1PPCAC_29529, partial [Pristionchus mayeri]